MLPKMYLRNFIFIKQPIIKQISKYIRRLYHNVNNDVDVIRLFEIKRTLKFINTPILDGHACIIANISLCEDVKRKNCKLYINKITGFFICENCNRSGPWQILEKFIQFQKTKKSEELSSLRKSIEFLPNINIEWNKLKESAESIQNLQIDVYKNISEKLNFQNVPQEIMAQMNLLYDHLSQTLYFPLMSFCNLIVGYKCLSTVSCVEKTVPVIGASGIILYKSKTYNSNETAIIVPNIEDLLVIAANKAANLIICFPYGIKNLPQEVLPCLESYNKFILWFGNDEPGWDNARHVAKKLDNKRCLFIRPTDLQPRPKIASDLGYNLKEIIQNAQPIWHKSITTFRSLRQDILSDLQNIDKVQGVKWIRYPALNKILKGHRRGEFTVLTGPTGSGKTTFMSEYSLDLAIQGVNTLWGSFEIKNSRLARTMLQQMIGVPLDENLEKFDVYADEFEKLPIFFMTFHGQQSIKLVMEAVEHATYMHDIAHVIIDNVQFMMGTLDESKFIDRFWKQDQIISAFRTFATKFNCHVSLVIHPRKEKEAGELTTSSIFGGVKASQEADNILIVQDKRLTNIHGKKYLQVAKNRYSGDLGIMILDFDKNSLSYAPKKKSKSNCSEAVVCEYLT